MNHKTNVRHCFRSSNIFLAICFHLYIYEWSSPALLLLHMSIHICYNVTSEDNLWEFVLSFHHMGSRNPTLLARLSAGTFTRWGTSLSLNILSDSKEWNDILIILKYTHVLWILKADSELSFPSSYPCTFYHMPFFGYFQDTIIA